MLLTAGSRAVFLHAHPDDETLATGVLLAELAARGAQPAVVTATRGERGEVVPGPLSALAGTEALVAHREGELAAALAGLGVETHAFLGSPPALAPGRQPRRYRDSGMRWLDEARTLAGPADTSDPSSLTAAGPSDAAEDFVAFVRAFRADVLVSYDAHGGYGHPDHVACHRIARLAAAHTGLPLYEVVSDASLPEPEAEVHELAGHLPTVRRALLHYASQLTVDGDEVVHVGGQRQPILTTLRLVRVGR